jgi:hypothetical protein
MARKRCTRLNPVDPKISAKTKKQWATPEYRAKQEAYHQKRREHPMSYYRRGVPDGMLKWEADLEWNFARMYAKEVTKIMVDKGHIEDDPKVVAAFQSAMEVLESPMSQAIKLQAARLILDFLKAKPVSKSEVTVQKAEDWLQAVTADALKAPIEGQ